MFLMRILFVVFLAGSVSAAYSEDGVQALLDRMNHALEVGSYQGTFVLMYGESIETMQVVRERSSAGVREKLISLTGDAREIIRDRGVLTCIWPKHKLVVIEAAHTKHRFPPSFVSAAASRLSHYKIVEMGHARVAGLRCKIIRFEPLDKLRYGHELCIGTGLGMLLESKTFDTNGKVIEKMMFTSFRALQSVPDVWFEPGVKLDDYTWKTAGTGLTEKLQPDPAWEIKNLPPGFSLNSVTRRLMSASKRPVQHIALSDGLASVSVFISKVDLPQYVYQGAHSKGVINAYIRNLNQHRITVVGEVPGKVVEMIGSSVFYAHP